MAINRNDDYEKLAKLLYPSIEASGNTYYGQTRRLTLDEVFNKNNGGFESHIESVRVDNPSADYGFTYDTLFCWKVGPLNGILKVDAEYSIGTYFAIYEIVSEPITNVNQLNSGEFNTYFNTYEYNTSCKFKEVKDTSGKSPVNNTDIYDGRNFYIYKDGIKNYIAVAVNTEKEVLYDENNPLKLTAVNGQVNIGLFIVNEGSVPIIDDATHPMYDYSTDGGETWNWCELSISELNLGTYIQLNPGKSAYFRLNSNAVKSFNTDRFVYFKFTGNGKVVASGDIRSMKQNPNGSLEFCEFNRLFWNCTQLIKAPSLPDKQLTDACYVQMFKGCTSLTETPKLIASELVGSCYAQMFSGCTSLNKVICYASDISEQHSTYLWLRNVASAGYFVTLSDTNWQIDSEDGIPTGWTRINTSDPTEYTGEDCKHNYLVTDGSNSSENGRGDITTYNTLFNMENSFDENGTHKMNTYNADGSFNQEIWGYKCFNSPVQFKNGIYSAGTNLKTVQEEIVNVDSDTNTGTLTRKVLGSEIASTLVDKQLGTLQFAELNTFFVHEDATDHTTISLQGIANCITSGNKRLTDIWDKYYRSNYDYDNDLSDNARDGSLIATTYDTGYKVIDGDTEPGDVASFISKTHIDKSSTLFKCTSETSNSCIALELNHKNLYTGVYCNFISSDYDSSITMLSSVGDSTALQSIMQCYFSANDGLTLNQQKNGGTDRELLKIDDSTINTCCNILPSVNNANLGSSSSKWDHIYCNSIYASNISYTIPDNIECISLTCSTVLPKSGGTMKIGDLNNRWSGIYTYEVNASNNVTTNYIHFSESSQCSIYSLNSEDNKLVLTNERDIVLSSFGTNSPGNIELATYSSRSDSGDIFLKSHGGVYLTAANKDIVISASTNHGIAVSSGTGDITVTTGGSLILNSTSVQNTGSTTRNTTEFINATYLSDYIPTVGNANELDLKPGTIVLIYIHDTTGGSDTRYLYPGAELTQDNTSQGYDIYLCRLKDGVFEESSDRYLKTGTKIRLMYEVVFTTSNRYARVLAQVI